VRQDPPRNAAASVKGRLLQSAREQREEFQNVLTRYAVERFLYRLSRSAYRRQFILKGANLFTLWLGAAHRSTRDLDFLGYGSEEIGPTVTAFQEICRQSVEEDGLVFEAESVKGAAVRESENYAGLRVTLQAMLGKAVIPLQIDIGFGDVITPAAQEAEMPSSLGTPRARLLTYSRETVVAEKTEAMIDLGLGNSRLKDFYDLWFLATQFDFEGLLLCQALAATFRRRGTMISALPPPALTAPFYADASRSRQWQSFLEKSGLPTDASIALDECTDLIRAFLLPPLQAVRDEAGLEALWQHEDRLWQEKATVQAEEAMDD